MPGIDHTVIRMKLEKLRLELDQASGSDVSQRTPLSLDQQVSALQSQMKMLVEILLYLGK